MQQIFNRIGAKIGGGGLAAIVAVSLAAGAIGWRLWDSSAPTASPAAAPSDPLAALEQKAQKNPDDAAAWQELGFAYFEAGRFADAATAYRKGTAAAPGSAILWSSLGEALVMASEREPMPAEALSAFRQSARLDAKDPRARYFLAVNRDLGGDHAGAIGDWLALLKDTPKGAPWETDLIRTIEQVGKINAIDTATPIEVARATQSTAPVVMPGIPGPSADQISAASALRPDEQQDMAEGMVARLAARLENDPANVDGWIMLMRSYTTLGREAEAKAALAKALAANPGARQKLADAAGVLGLS